MPRSLLVLCSCFLAAAGWLPPLARPAPEGPLHHWRFATEHYRDGAFADLAGGLPVRALGSVAFGSAGGEAALRLPGDSSLTLRIADDIAALPMPRRALTVEAWLRPADPAGFGSVIGAFQNNGGFQAGWMLNQSGDRVVFALASQGVADRNGDFTYLESRPLEPGRWFHLAATYDGAVMRLYVDGLEQAASERQSGDILYPPHAFYEIGSYHDAWSCRPDRPTGCAWPPVRRTERFYPLSGEIAEVLLYDHALPAGAVRARAASRPALSALPAVHAGAPRLLVEPYLQQVTPTGATILWETDRPSTSRVAFGATAALGRAARTDGLRGLHEVALTGLEPGAVHHYRIESVTAAGDTLRAGPFAFRTAPAARVPVAFALIGDTQFGGDRSVWQRLAAHIRGERPDFVLHVGDLVDNGRNARNWLYDFFEPARELFRHVPFFSIPGNHEDEGVYYYKYAANPAPESYYTFRYGDAQFFMLDSELDLEPGSAQYRWLEDALRSSTARWKIAAHHRPPITDDADETTGAVASDPRVRHLPALYERYGVDLVAFGHIHAYRRSWPLTGSRVDLENGVYYVQAGGGGGGLVDPPPTHSWHTAKTLREHHYVYVVLHESRLELRAYDVDGRLFDQLTIER